MQIKILEEIPIILHVSNCVLYEWHEEENQGVHCVLTHVGSVDESVGQFCEDRQPVNMMSKAPLTLAQFHSISHGDYSYTGSCPLGLMYSNL